MFEILDKYLNLIVDEQKVGYILFDEQADYVVGSYIFVDPAERGKGYAGTLVKEFVSFSQNKGKKIKPVCPVIKGILEKEYPEMIF